MKMKQSVSTLYSTAMCP